MESEDDIKDTVLDLQLKKRLFRGEKVKVRVKTETTVRSYYSVPPIPPPPPIVFSPFPGYPMSGMQVDMRPIYAFNPIQPNVIPVNNMNIGNVGNMVGVNVGNVSNVDVVNVIHTESVPLQYENVNTVSNVISNGLPLTVENTTNLDAILSAASSAINNNLSKINTSGDRSPPSNEITTTSSPSATSSPSGGRLNTNSGNQHFSPRNHNHRDNNPNKKV